MLCMSNLLHEYQLTSDKEVNWYHDAHQQSKYGDQSGWHPALEEHPATKLLAVTAAWVKNWQKTLNIQLWSVSHCTFKMTIRLQSASIFITPVSHLADLAEFWPTVSDCIKCHRNWSSGTLMDLCTMYDNGHLLPSMAIYCHLWPSMAYDFCVPTWFHKFHKSMYIVKVSLWLGPSWAVKKSTFAVFWWFSELSPCFVALCSKPFETVWSCFPCFCPCFSMIFSVSWSICRSWTSSVASWPCETSSPAQSGWGAPGASLARRARPLRLLDPIRSHRSQRDSQRIEFREPTSACRTLAHGKTGAKYSRVVNACRAWSLNLLKACKLGLRQLRQLNVCVILTSCNQDTKTKIWYKPLQHRSNASGECHRCRRPSGRTLARPRASSPLWSNASHRPLLWKPRRHCRLVTGAVSTCIWQEKRKHGVCPKTGLPLFIVTRKLRINRSDKPKGFLAWTDLCMSRREYLLHDINQMFCPDSQPRYTVPPWPSNPKRYASVIPGAWHIQ